MRIKGLAHPDKPDIICSITPEMAAQISELAGRRKVGLTTMGRTLWTCGCCVIVARHYRRSLHKELKPLVDAIPVEDDVEQGGERLRINVLQDDLDRLRIVAEAQGKKTAQLHRNALAVGIWVYEQIGIVWDMAGQRPHP